MTEQELAYKLGLATGKLSKALERQKAELQFADGTPVDPEAGQYFHEMDEVEKLLVECAGYFYQAK